MPRRYALRPMGAMHSMKPLQVEFLHLALQLVQPKRSGNWHRVLTVIALAVAAVALWRGLQLRTELNQLRQAAATAPLLPVSPQAESLPPYHADLQRLVKTASRDVGQLLAQMESVRGPGIRLKSFDVDTFEGIARAQFEMQSLGQLSLVMESLNGAAGDARWHVVSVEAPRDGGAVVLQLRYTWTK